MDKLPLVLFSGGLDSSKYSEQLDLGLERTELGTIEPDETEPKIIEEQDG